MSICRFGPTDEALSQEHENRHPSRHHLVSWAVNMGKLKSPSELYKGEDIIPAVGRY